MINPKYPNVDDTDTFNVMKACRILDIDKNTLRRYTKNGFISCSYNPLGRKVYTGAELKRLYILTA